MTHKYSTKGETPKHVADAADKAETKALRAELNACKVDVAGLKKPAK
jgi:hypothetical protein